MSGTPIVIMPETFFDTTLSEAERKPTRICGVYPAKAHIIHSGKIYTVPEYRDGMRVAMSDPVCAGTERKDYGNGQLLVLESISARDNALDAIGLSRERVNSRGERTPARTTSDWWESGYFVPAGDEPTDDEIAAAKSRLNEWARKWVLKGAEIFGTTQKANQVDFRAKLAARILRVRRPWAEGISEVQQKTLRPSCRNEINTGATKCPACGDRFVYVNGRPVLKEDVEVPVPAMPPQPQGQQQKGQNRS